MDATVQVENYQKIEASQFGDEAPALSRTIDQWNNGDTQRLLASIRDLLFIRPDIAERKQAEAEAHADEWGRNGYPEPDLTTEQKQSWDFAIGVQFSDHPGSHGVLLRIQDLIPYRLELHFLSLLHELKDEGDDMKQDDKKHEEILAAIKANLSLSADISSIKTDVAVIKSDTTTIKSDLKDKPNRDWVQKWFIGTAVLATLAGYGLLNIQTILGWFKL